MIKIKERNKTDLFIRCNTEIEKRYVMSVFLELKSQPRMDDQIIVKNVNGKELRLPKKELPPAEESKPFAEGVEQESI